MTDRVVPIRPSNEEVDRREREAWVAHGPDGVDTPRHDLILGPGARPPVDTPLSPMADRRDPRTPAGSRRPFAGGARPAAVVLLLAGGWLAVSPLLLAYAPGDPAWGDVVAGVVIAALGLGILAGRAASVRTAVMVAVAGLWVLASALWVADSATVVGNEVLTGAVVLFAALAVAGALRR